MLRGAEMAVASAQVISHRSETIRTACHNPAAADYPELFGMVAEKFEAFARANIALLQDLGTANVDLLANASRLAA